MFVYTPLLGAQTDSAASQSILELEGDIKILIDVGWDTSFDVEQLQALKQHVPTLSIILLTHATTSHLGAYAHCCKHFPHFTRVPVYATAPVISLGRTMLQDMYASNTLAATLMPLQEQESYQSNGSKDTQSRIVLPAPTPDEIASYFAQIHPLKYSQPHQPLPSPFSPPLGDLQITAHNAGHSLGGTIWHIQHNTESIVHAFDWHQGRENVFDGASWLSGAGGGGAEIIEQLRKPSALICSAKGSRKTAPSGGKSTRDTMLLTTIKQAVAKGGNVLIPTDSTARVLELAYVLEQAWRSEAAEKSSNSPMNGATLYMASKTCGTTMRLVRSMLEWMDDGIARDFEIEGAAANNRNGTKPSSEPLGSKQRATRSTAPFEFNHLSFIESSRRLEKILALPGPRVILANDATVGWGFSKRVLAHFAAGPENLVILTDQSQYRQESPAKLLWEHFSRITETRTASETSSSPVVVVSAEQLKIVQNDAHRKALDPNNNLAYQHFLAAQKQMQNFGHNITAGNMEDSANVLDDASSSSSSSDNESNAEMQGKALNATQKTDRFNKTKAEPSRESLGVNALLRCNDCYDFDVRGKKGRDSMFPYETKRRRADEFGEIIRPEDYLRAEERDDLERTDARSAVVQPEDLGQKRKWLATGAQQRSDALDVKPMRTDPDLVSGVSRVVRSTNLAMDSIEHRDAEVGETQSEDEDDSWSHGPAKLEMSHTEISLNLQIAAIDYAGLHDQRSLFMLIPLIKPNKLILVGGNADDTDHLAKECRSKLCPDVLNQVSDALDRVFTPVNGQSIDASVDTNAWSVKLSEALSRNLKWQSVRGLSVVNVAGYLLPAKSMQELSPDEVVAKKKAKVLDEQPVFKPEAEPPMTADSSESKGINRPPTLDILPIRLASNFRSISQPLHVGDLRLADLRKLLHAAGHSAEFRGEGTLLVDEKVIVRKSSAGRVEVENSGTQIPFSRGRQIKTSFDATRQQIYASLAVIAGG